ncbi:hypothetical protein [Paenibacillus tengchongensis]|uniref:hypothetical protein n=1 Tax=Paenibacillus tengchongensis TaxID=2608684 RepID=UPI00124C50B0|nr:hypothetical protein [Paenibacillus tengchongensis]
MSKRIQAYFRSEDEAEGAKTSLIPYGVGDMEVSALTDPLRIDGKHRRNILLPLVPYNNSAMAGGAFGAVGSADIATGPVVVPSVALNDDELDRGDLGRDSEHSEVYANDGDLDDINYVMDLKVADESYHEVVETLRGKHAYVEVFD